MRRDIFLDHANHGREEGEGVARILGRENLRLDCLEQIPESGAKNGCQVILGDSPSLLSIMESGRDLHGGH